MPARATHKGRERWTRWSGTPGLIADVAREVEARVAAGDAGPTDITIKVMASAWESEFITPDDFQGGIDEAGRPGHRVLRSPFIDGWPEHNGDVRPSS